MKQNNNHLSNSSMNHSPFYFIRHGETDWNMQGLITGQQDILLNEMGIAQAHQAKQHLQNLDIKTLCVSSLKRAQHTAEIINETLKCPIVVMDELRECAAGIRE